MKKITVKTTINTSIEKAWEFWTKPEHIIHWNFASSDWCCPKADNNLKAGGHFNWRMEPKDGTMGFDFEGTYNTIVPYKHILYTLQDNRQVAITFTTQNDHTVTISETFDPETINSAELQQAGWQAILNQFKTYAESH